MHKINFSMLVAFLSILCFQVMYLVYHWYIFKRKEYLAYVCYLLVAVAYFTNLNYSILLGHETDSPIQHIIKRPLAILIYICYYTFMVDFLEFRLLSATAYKRIGRFRTVMLLSLPVFFILPFFPELQLYADIGYLSFSLFIFFFSLYFLTALWRIKTTFSSFFLKGSIAALTGGFIANILAWGLGDAPPLLRFIYFASPMTGIIIEVCFFSSGLAYKASQLEREMLQSKNDLIAELEKNQQLMLDKQEIRNKIAQDIHDDLGGNISTIRMMSDLMVQQPFHNDQVMSFSRKISAAAGEIAQRMHTIIWSMNPENDTLQNFTEYVHQYGVTFFEDSTIHFSCYTEGIGDGLKINGIVRKNLFLIIKEIFHNALKHSEADRVDCTISLEKAALHILISDNGKGFRKENVFGNGMKNIQTRIRDLGAAINMETTDGTRISIKLGL